MSPHNHSKIHTANYRFLYWFRYILLRSLVIYIIFQKKLYRFEIRDQLDLSLFLISNGIMLLFFFEAMITMIKSFPKTSPFSKKHRFLHHKEHRSSITSFQLVYILFLIVFFSTNSAVGGLIHNAYQVVQHTSSIDQIQIDNRSIDQIKVHTIQTAPNFYFDSNQKIFRYSKGSEKYLKVNVYGIAPIVSASSHKYQHFLVSHQDQEFKRDTKMPRHELNPEIQKLALRAQWEVSKHEVIKDVCVSRIALWREDSYKKLVEKSLPSSNTSPYLFLKIDRDYVCSERFPWGYLVLLFIAGSTEVVLLISLISMRFNIDQTIEKLDKKHQSI